MIRNIWLFFKNILRRIDRFFNPYKYTYTDDDFEQYKKGKKLTEKMSGLSAEEIVENDIQSFSTKRLHSRINEQSAIDHSSDYDFDTLLWYRDNNVHQIVMKFKTNSYERYQHRSSSARQRLEPLVYPIHIGKPFDRTHLIPVGYHGSENDNLLLVGWDSDLNRNQMNDFEQTVRVFNSNQTIVWFTSIEQQSDGTVRWYTKIFNEFGKELTSDDWHDRSTFKWKPNIERSDTV